MSNNCEYCSYGIDEDNTCVCIGGDLRILKQENARLRESLSWYADKNNYKYINQYNRTLPLDDHDFNVNFSDKFGGKRARKALGSFQ